MRSVFEGLQADTDFFIIRHGESEGNREGRIQGHTDYPLTEQGISDAYLAGNWLAPQDISVVFTSPLLRARQTAAAIIEGAALGSMAAIPCEDLIEIDTGSFSNRRFKDLAIEEPESYREFHAHSWEAVPGAETLVHIRQRAVQHWANLVAYANSGHRKLASVSHFGCIQWLFKTSLNPEANAWLPLISVGNCAVFHIFVSPRQSKSGTSYYSEWRLVNSLEWQG